MDPKRKLEDVTKPKVKEMFTMMKNKVGITEFVSRQLVSALKTRVT